VEQCFVTNQEDVEEFGTDEGCAKAAQAYYQAICKYLEDVEKDAEK
jgi:N-acetylmuramoyl-L-alanine amidase